MEQDSQDPEATVRDLIEKRYGQDDWQTWRESTATLTRALRTLTREQAQRLAADAWARYPHDDIASVLGRLNVSVPGALAELHPALVADERFLQGWLYLGASAEVTERLLRLVDDTPLAGNRNLLLYCLAWGGGGTVSARFHEWRKSPPRWRGDLYQPPEDYALDAGWELTPDGERRNLYHDIAYELAMSTAPTNGSSAGMEPSEESDTDQCLWCGRPLVALFDLDLANPRCHFLAGEGTRLRIAHCLWCSAYATVFTDIDLGGGSRWSDANGEKPKILDQVGTGEGEEVPAPLPHGMALGTRRRTPFEAVGRFSSDETGISQLGGHPEWVQNPDYPRCPGCGRRMECVGQVSWEDTDEWSEGCTYVFLCLPCGKATTVYQQT